MNIANKIDAKDKKLSEILSGQRYRIEMFQRGYRWQYTQLEALISDLAGCFMKSYSLGDGIEKYVDYDSYYMGPIVLCQDERGDLSIIDGQQRLTTFSLLLIYLSHLQDLLGVDELLKKDMDQFLHVKKGGKRTLVLNVDERIDIMENLINTPIYVLSEDTILPENESVQNIVACYNVIDWLFPRELNNADVLPIFIEWLLDKVVLVEVRAYSMENAYTIFETMNDRGLTLNPTEMLKGYLLSKIVEEAPENEDKAEEANRFWNDRLLRLKYSTQNENEMDFFRAWLRGRYADTKRQKIKGAENEDFEKIGTQYHTWVKNNTKRLGLKKQMDFFYFIRSDFEFYSALYEKIMIYKLSQTKGQELVYLNSFYSIADSLSFPLYLSSISKLDDISIVELKISQVSSFIDKLVNIRSLHQRSITQSSVRDILYEHILRIRNKDITEQNIYFRDELSKVLNDGPVYEKYQVMNNWGYYHYFFARIEFFINPCNDFAELLRSRKQSSYVLSPLFTETDFQQCEQEDWTGYVNSVSNYFLIRRKDYKDYVALKTIMEKMDYLKQNNSLREFKDIPLPNGVFELLRKRNEIISCIAEMIWGRVES